ncbi:MAG: hypothetical protein IAG10_32350 [Planctomycetaceae bacterium]|nr:hypothetical protein [Planctomycetaceae bacterium]
MTNTVSRVISDETLSRIIHIESGGKPNAKAPTSSALGLGQFLSATWTATVRKHRPDWFVGHSQSDVLARRIVPRDSIEMLARFTEDNAATLGTGYSDGDLYLAHFSGAGTARKLLRASAGAPASSVFSQAAIDANRSILQGKNCGQVRAWAAQKMLAAGGRNWVAVHLAGAKPVLPPVKKPAVSATTKATATAATVAVGGAGAAAAQAGLSALSVIAIIAGASLAAGAVILIIYRITKGFWPWTGSQSQELLLPSHLPSEKSLELASAQLALSSADLLARPSPLPSEPIPPLKLSAKPLPRTRTRRKSSKGLKRSAAKKSSPKRKSKSKS